MLFLLGAADAGLAQRPPQADRGQLGVGILLALLLLPVLIGFPSVIGQLVPPLLEALGDAAGPSGPPQHSAAAGGPG